MRFSRRGRVREFGLAVLLGGAVAALTAQAGPGLGPSLSASSGRPHSGSVTGRITGAQGAPLAGVTVILRNSANGAESIATTDEDGAYRFAGLAPGPYSVKAETAESESGQAQEIEVVAGRESDVQPALAAGVAAAAATTTITGEQLESVPVNGRRWQDLFLDTAAVAPGAGNTQVALRGSEQDPADTTVDGASVRLAFGAAAGSGPALAAQDPSGFSQQTPQGTGRGWSGGHGFVMSLAAIREVRLVAGNVEVEGANASGGRAGIVTESGSNPLHGQGFFSDRENTWGAQNPFTEWVQNTGTVAAPSFTAAPYTPPDHEVAWGIGAGSRILRDRLFWFGALDGYRRNNPGVATARDYQQLFPLLEPTSPQIVLLSAQLNESQNQAYDDYLGIPRAGIAGAGLEQLAGLLGPAQRSASQWVGFARLDWQAAERHRLTLETTAADWNSAGGGLQRVSENYGNHSFGSSEARQQWLMGRWEAYLTPNILLLSQASIGREVLSAPASAPSDFEQNFLGSGWNGYGQLPQIVVDSRYGFTMGNPARFGQGNYPDEHLARVQELVNWASGNLLLKAGGEVGYNSDATTLLRNQTGSYYYKVENFIADALAYEKYGAAPSNYQYQHNCNPAHNGLGTLPCYSYFSQVIGPNYWRVSTSDLAGYVSAQWQLAKFAVASAGLRWERELLPPPMKLLDNPDLPLTERLPNLGDEWGPRVSLALGNRRRWPVLRMGYGMYFGRTENATLLTAMTQTGSRKGDLYVFIRPTDGYTSTTNTSIAPPFPHVLSGLPGSVVTPGAVEYAPGFRNPEVHQALAALEQRLPGGLMLTAGAMMSLGRRLPIAFDTNFDPAVNPGAITYNVTDKTEKGPIKAARITVPYYALWPFPDCGGAAKNVAGQCGRLNPKYQQITEIESRANSKYEAVMVRLTRYGRRGLGLHAHYTYAHAVDWNPNETTLVAGSDVLDPEQFDLEYGTSNLDIRHSAAVMVIYRAPWKLGGWAGHVANGWLASGIGQFRSGMPYTMRTTGIPKEMDNFGNPTILAVAPGINGSGGDNRVYGVGSDGRVYNVGRNTFRYPNAWKADVRLGKQFALGEQRELELLAESFNLLNHRNVTEIKTTGYEISAGTVNELPSLTYLTEGSTGAAATTPAFGQPFNINATNFYRERQIQIGARLRF